MAVGCIEPRAHYGVASGRSFLISRGGGCERTQAVAAKDLRQSSLTLVGLTMWQRLRPGRKAALAGVFSLLLGAALAAPNPKAAAPKGGEGYQTPATTAIFA